MEEKSISYESKGRKINVTFKGGKIPKKLNIGTFGVVADHGVSEKRINEISEMLEKRREENGDKDDDGKQL